MKIYKFRVYDKKRRMMVYPENFGVVRLPWYDHGDVEFMISTGILDKNKKEIYEYDIVKSDYGYHYIVYYDFERVGFYPFSKGDGCGCCEKHTILPVLCEVVGNVYETPELIKGVINANILR